MSADIRVGDCLDVLRTLDAESVQTCVTSPPYFGLRDYGVAGQIGLESTPDAYVAKLVDVFGEVRRVLKDDGTLWLNLGDSYAGVGAQTGGTNSKETGRRADRMHKQGYRQPAGFGLKAKDLYGIPWRVAFALQADGWYLRSDIIWHKPNPMPESVTDRPTKAHEYLFLLAKAERYYYDAEAIKEPVSELSVQIHGTGYRDGGSSHKYVAAGLQGDDNRTLRGNGASRDLDAGRNRRTVWTVATQPYSGAHFATFPPALIEPCILAGTSPKACEHCSAAWERLTERTTTFEGGSGRAGRTADEVNSSGKWMLGGESGNANLKLGPVVNSNTIGWSPRCDCANNTGSGRCVVLDPFGGAGTTGLVADRLGRNALLIELNPAYAELARRRIADDAPLFNAGEVA